jgi:hypothetical protein
MLINHTENWSGVEILACEDLLVVMEEEESRVQISLWNGRSETWLTDLDISVAGLTHFSFEPVRICLSKNLLAVFVTEPEYRTFFWQLKTSQPTATSPQFLGSVKLTQGEIELNDDEEFDSLKSEILMNENIFAKYFDNLKLYVPQHETIGCILYTFKSGNPNNDPGFALLESNFLTITSSISLVVIKSKSKLFRLNSRLKVGSS